MTASYQIPAQSISVEIEVRKSRFICHVAPANSSALAKQIIASITEKYSDATHNCWAFQTEEPGSSRSIGCSDDGEPHGTAGKPMLNILSHADIGEVVAVVTRYYGGTKLGTGGLARAYSESVKAALDKLKTCVKIDWQQATLTFDYGLQSLVENVLADFSVEIISSVFDDKVSIELRYDVELKNAINSRLSNLSQGKLSLPCHLDD